MMYICSPKFCTPKFYIVRYGFLLQPRNHCNNRYHNEHTFMQAEISCCPTEPTAAGTWLCICVVLTLIDSKLWVDFSSNHKHILKSTVLCLSNLVAPDPTILKKSVTLNNWSAILVMFNVEVSQRPIPWGSGKTQYKKFKLECNSEVSVCNTTNVYHTNTVLWVLSARP